MRKDEKPYHILIIEDNLGDYILIEEYLAENILEPDLERVETFHSAKQLLEDKGKKFDLVFLDLSLPDLSGEQLIREVLELTEGIPVVALTGFSDLDFSIKSLSLGISDYLLKDELTPVILYKSIIYAIQRSKFIDDIQKSEKRYSDLFQLSPLPMWVYDLKSLRFLDINQAAVDHYGYSEEEFLLMKISDIRPADDLQLMDQALKAYQNGEKLDPKNIYKHKKKNGDIIKVEATIRNLLFNDREAVLVLVNDITERLRYVETIEKQNQTFREIAWIQSHVVRAPLARLLGLVSLLESEISDQFEETTTLVNYIKDSAIELDEIVREISKKSENIAPLEKP
ncbi:PAS domain S-box protein [Algoriphagus lacus]|uniref:PAS domain S-box protein n=1 Tax=Algoriphagus lacus TaxID=2056311 RepID=A0A418PQV3_9BACT|nr:PAS domain S-box protein [Algoriphagus lacus]RIW14982.1 PAS domain S-box protein [Algoriphagus lacus]